MSGHQDAIRTTYISIFSNILLAGIKILSGFIGQSYALIADGIESTTDVFSSALVLFGLKYSSKPADENHPYGHGKIEPLITFLVVLFLVISALVIVYQSVQNIMIPHNKPEPWTLIILSLIILWKELSYRFVAKKGRESNSTSLQADAWHHRSDAITSLFAFIGISISLFMGEGYESADDWAALLASTFIFYNSYLIFRPALGEVMDEHAYDDLVIEIRNISQTVKGVVATEKCYVRKMGMKFYVDLHVEVDGEISVRQGHEISHRLKDVLLRELPTIEDVLIHIEPEMVKEF